MSNIKIGNFLYGHDGLLMYGKVLDSLMNHENGVLFTRIASNPSIMRDCGNDNNRAQNKVKVALSNLRIRGLVSETRKDHAVSYKIADKNLALELVKASNEFSIAIQRVVEVADKAKIVSSANNSAISIGSKKMIKNQEVAGVKVVKVKAVKIPRTWMNQETGNIEAFGLGRPSAVKLACECDSDGKLLNASGYATLVQGNADKKLLKAELVDLVANLRKEVKALKAERDQWAAIAQSNDDETVEDSETDETVEDSETDETVEDYKIASDSESLELNAEPIENTDEFTIASA